MFLTYVVDKKCENLTINQILKNELNLSSRLLTKLIKNNLIYLNNSHVDTRQYVKIGDILKVDLNYPEESDNIISSNIHLDIIYEDDCFLIINKPAGIAIHPSMQHYNNTIANGIKFYFDSINLKKKIRPVNRLDFYTSGLVIFAKNEYIQECLIKQMKDKTLKKYYLAIINGILESDYSTINKPIARKENSIIERCISDSGKQAITNYRVLKKFNSHSLVECNLETGRTHQIRVHFLSIGHPLLGDSLYGESSSLIKGQALLCYKLSFIHPITQKKLAFELPKNYFESLYEFL